MILIQENRELRAILLRVCALFAVRCGREEVNAPSPGTESRLTMTKFTAFCIAITSTSGIAVYLLTGDTNEAAPSLQPSRAFAHPAAILQVIVSD